MTMPRFALPAPDRAAEDAARARQGRLTKPTGSLGRLEALAIRLAAWQGTEVPASRPAAALVFAADHPVTRHDVSAYPAAVTPAMVSNFLAGGAAASVAARTLGVPLTVVDVGVDGAPGTWESTGHARFRSAPVGPAGDLRTEDALPGDSLVRAVEAGRAAVDAHADGARVVVLGEMGIGNTTPAAAIGAALLGLGAEAIVGPGTGVDAAGLGRKATVVREALARARVDSPWRALQAVGGREIAALVGAMGRALERRSVVLVDGFVVTAAALVLVRLQPEAARGLVFAHRSAEPGHARMLAALDAEPLLDLGMRLGEGSGALAALPLLDLACALHGGMATFDSAGVPDR